MWTIQEQTLAPQKDGILVEGRQTEHTVVRGSFRVPAWGPCFFFPPLRQRMQPWQHNWFRHQGSAVKLFYESTSITDCIVLPGPRCQAPLGPTIKQKCSLLAPPQIQPDLGHGEQHPERTRATMHSTRLILIAGSQRCKIPIAAHTLGPLSFQLARKTRVSFLRQQAKKPTMWHWLQLGHVPPANHCCQMNIMYPLTQAKFYAPFLS